MSSSCLPLKPRLLNVLHRCLQLSCLLNDFWPSHHLFFLSSLYRSSLKPISLSCHRIILLSLVLIRWCPIYSQCSPHAGNDTAWPITRELISSFFLMVQRALCTHSHEIVPHSITLQQHCCKWNGLFASLYLLIPAHHFCISLGADRQRSPTSPRGIQLQWRLQNPPCVETMASLYWFCTAAAEQSLVLCAWTLWRTSAWKGLLFCFFLGKIVFSQVKQYL